MARKKNVEEGMVASSNKTMTKILIGTGLVAAAIVGVCYFAGDKIERSVATLTEGTPAGTVAAVVDGKDITVEELRAQAQKVPQLAELPFEVIYPRLLDSVINMRIMLAGAEKAGIENDPKVQEILKNHREQVLAQMYVVKQLESMVTPKQLQEVYIQQIQNFERPEEVRARHILVKTEKEAKDVLIQLRAGADFNKVAQKKSLDQETTDLGYFRENEMIPEFSKPVFALKKGQLSKPIQTPFGWHIVVVDDRRLAAPPSFDEVKDQLKQLFMEQNMPQLLEQERKNMNVEIKIPTLLPVAPQPAVTEEVVAKPAQPETVEVAPAVVETPTETPAETASVETPAETPAAE